MNASDKIYSEVTIKRVKAFRVARYVMLTFNLEDDVSIYMDYWDKRSGLLETDSGAMGIGLNSLIRKKRIL